MIEKLAKSNLPILILGETGSGKSHLAREIHELSARRGAFVSANLSAMSKELIESELFGHEAGAFTGAGKMHRGLFEQARGGTLLLDEIGEISTELQKKLLLVLEERAFRRVGGEIALPYDCKLIFATNKSLVKLAQSGEFRADLYYRISGHTHRVDNLCELMRKNPKFIEQFYERLCDQGLKRVVIDDTCLAWMNTLPWPGNIRQLKMAIEASIELLSEGQLRLGIEQMKQTVAVSEVGRETRDEYDNGTVISVGEDTQALAAYHECLAQFERKYFERALQEYGGRINQIARGLSINKTTLLAKLRRYDMKAENYRNPCFQLLKACS